MILGICGSPRKKTTHHVLSLALKMLEKRGVETTLFSAHDSKIEFCRHCDFCRKSKRCVHEDDMAELYELLEASKGVILATPVHNGGVSAHLKAMMERTRALLFRNPKALAGKPGMGIAVGGDRNGGQDLTLLEINAFFIMNRMIPVSGGNFGANLGAAFWSRDTLEGVRSDEEGIRSLEMTVNRFAEWVERAGKLRESF
ncbi:NAD(P)H-dependent oxidoreductase [Geoglobus acetivorans]|uniref:Flavodoxin family protein n=1 Tax=Geoglobus acetivorans TaxID=565033 RepID=A0ABZ3H4N2_GEOAI|nr:flavodoxin family protein [Geoglobus acetivorans]